MAEVIKKLKIIKLPVVKQGIPTQKMKHSNSMFFLLQVLILRVCFLRCCKNRSTPFTLISSALVSFTSSQSLSFSLLDFCSVMCWCERLSMIYILTEAEGGVLCSSSADHVTFDTSQALMHVSASVWKLQHRHVNRETHFLPRILSFWFCNLFPPVEEAYFTKPTVFKNHVTLFDMHTRAYHSIGSCWISKIYCTCTTKQIRSSFLENKHYLSCMTVTLHTLQ